MTKSFDEKPSRPVDNTTTAAIRSRRRSNNAILPFAAPVCLVMAAMTTARAVEPDHAGSAAVPQRPNIILCMADDLGYGDPGFMGNPVINTPNLDAMAEAGLKMDRFYAAAPVCSPTRGSCLTGRHPFRYGVFFANVGHMRPEELTLAELVRRNGYATGHFGKWHLGTLSRTAPSRNRGAGPTIIKHFSPPTQNGFDVCFSTEAKVPTWDPMIWPGKSGTWWDPIEDESKALVYGEPYRQTDGSKAEENLRGDDSRVIMDRAEAFIRDAVQRRKCPFLAVIWFHAPHLPVVSGDEFIRHYPDCDKYERHYYGCITAMDHQIGRLRDTLDELGVAENTLLWFTSDNGPEGKAGSAPGSAGRLRGRKRSLFEGGIRVPGLVEWPAVVEAGRTTEFPATTSDYLPTVLDILDLTMPDDRPLDGISLLPLLRGQEMPGRPPLAFESAGQLALIDGRFKIVGRVPRNKGGNGGTPPEFMLFDLGEDPEETKDLAAEMPERLEAMKQALDAWRASCRRSLKGGDYR